MPKKFRRSDDVVMSGKRYPINTRTTADLRNKLVESALQSGRSMSQEIEMRLELSFDHERLEHIEKSVAKIESIITLGLGTNSDEAAA